MRRLTRLPSLLKGSFADFNNPARALLAQMTLEEKIAQMTQPDKLFIQSPDEVASYSLGSVLSGGDSDPKTGNDLISWTDMYDEYQSPRVNLASAHPTHLRCRRRSWA